MSYPAPAPAPKKHRVWPWLLGGALVFACAGGVTAVVSVFGDADPAPVHLAPETAAPVKAAPQKSNGPAAIGEGTWLVGEDVKPGKYRTSGALDSALPLCYWHTAKDDGGTNILTQGVADKVKEPGRVTLKAGQYFKTSGCADWQLVK